MLTTLAALVLTLPPATAPRPPAGAAFRDTAGYWQQDVHYTIRAGLDERSGVLSAAGQLIYRNNSPDTLRDLYFHLYLNAFRPHSLWSADETRQGIRRFADLPDPYNAFEHLQRVRVAGADLAVDYPYAPDSTIAHVALPAPLVPGDSLVVLLAWQARPSVIPRRQGRQGRRFDFAQWYPKVSVYDRFGWEAHPFHLAGELYGEYGTYDVTLDLADDQVVVATALPVAGDPGWARARATPDTPVTLQADWYGPSSRPGEMDWTEGLAPGRKRVRFYAEHIHHFAWSVNPEYRYEEGRFGDVVLRTLYLPQDSATWGGGRVIERLRRAMAWLGEIYGPYVYPQTIAIHRIEGGGTEFPMMVMNGGPEESLIFHEVGHIYTYGILGNNEWKDGWLDEGFTTFQTAWNFQRRGMGVPSTRTQQLILGMDLDGWSQPIATRGEDFDDFGVYNRMIYTKGQLFYEMLRYRLGEATFRRGLHRYYDQWKLKHVDEHALRTAMEEVSGQDLSAFFAQWLHGTPLVDYAIGPVRRTRQADGSWRTVIAVRRLGDGEMPVDVAVPVGDSTWIVRAPGIAREDSVVVMTPVRPGRVELDPARQTMDWNYLNNRETRKPVHLDFLDGENRLGWSDRAPARRDRMVFNWLPLAWYSDAGGVTVGLQSRSNYLGRFERNTAQAAVATRRGASPVFGYYTAMRNPVWARAPRLNWGVEQWMLDGRIGGRLTIEHDDTPHLYFGPRRSHGVAVTIMDVHDTAYVRPGAWNRALTGEATFFSSALWAGAGHTTRVRASYSLGGAINRAPLAPPNEISHPFLYNRGAIEVVHHRPLGPLGLGLRAYAGGYQGNHGSVQQRRVFVAGADPYERFANPFLRSRGALLARRDVNYSMPGGAGLRGYDPDLAADWAVATSVELTRTLVRQPRRRLFSSVTVAAFGDAGLVSRNAALAGRRAPDALADGGVGLRATHRIGPTTFTTRMDFPVLVSAPSLAAGADPARDGRARFRFVWSLEEAF